MTEFTNASPSTPPLGIIEGFFGRPWSWEAREAYAGFLATKGFDFYLYAPKSDAYLRRQWQQDWPELEWAKLKQLRECYRSAGVRFGLGLSPLELYRQPIATSRQQLKHKVLRLNDLKPDILCLLFDDMRGDLPDLAHRQAELAQVAAEYTTATHLILCPTYYSPDPILEKVFGARPKQYWETLGRQLPEAMDIFWTGPLVCSTTYPRSHLLEMTEQLGRKPFLWDNYPVNDGAVKSKLLPLMAYPETHCGLSDLVSGHAANPMNQASLSKIPLATLTEAYRLGAYGEHQHQYQAPDAFWRACREICSEALAEQLIADQPQLQDEGLATFTEEQRQQLLERYRPLSNEAPAQEIIDWLEGGYAFDPACLTE